MKLPNPSHGNVARARLKAGLTQVQAGKLVHLGQPGLRWSEYERGIRNMDMDRWELFLIKTGQYPTCSVINGMIVIPVFYT